MKMKISDVFTPKRNDLNLITYIPRPKLEKNLYDAIDSGMHVIVCGESGSGKSWLYKKVFIDNNIEYKIANCASTARLGTISNTIWHSIIPEGYRIKTSTTDAKKAEANAYFAKGALENLNTYITHQEDPLYEAFYYLRSNSTHSKVILVLDNLEFIFKKEDLMRELGSIIMLLDDEKYSKLNIQILIVGVPSGILEYFSQAENLESISNRLTEVEKVPPLTKPMIHTLCSKGFKESLKMNVNEDDIELISNHIKHITLGVAQRVQDYCLKLAKEIDSNNNTFTKNLLSTADIEWLKGNFRKCYSVIESFLINAKNGANRRNQVIYCIGLTQSHEFNSDTIEQLIKNIFPESFNGQKINFHKIFSDLCQGDSPLIKKGNSKGYYLIADSKYLMTIRAMLYINMSTKDVEKKKFVLG